MVCFRFVLYKKFNSSIELTKKNRARSGDEIGEELVNNSNEITDDYNTNQSKVSTHTHTHIQRLY